MEKKIYLKPASGRINLILFSILPVILLFFFTVLPEISYSQQCKFNKDEVYQSGLVTMIVKSTKLKKGFSIWKTETTYKNSDSINIEYDLYTYFIVDLSYLTFVKARVDSSEITLNFDNGERYQTTMIENKTVEKRQATVAALTHEFKQSYNITPEIVNKLQTTELKSYSLKLYFTNLKDSTPLSPYFFLFDCNEKEKLRFKSMATCILSR